MRTRKSIRNVSTMFLTQFITLALAFISRTIFIKTLGAEYLGLNGLFSNVLNALSIAEMGIGTAISYALYKPIAENDKEQIKSLLAFYRKCYFFVGAFVIIMGFILIPFLPYLMKSEVSIPESITQIYLCFLINSGIGYFFAHKRIIIDDTQNKYLTNAIDFTSKLLISIVQIFILVKFQNYMFFLYAQVFGTLIASLTVYSSANKKFPYIMEKYEPLSYSIKKKIQSNISILFLHKLATVIVFGSDFILISALVGLTELGLYSNYTLIITTVAIFINLFIIGADASIGNAIATLKKEELYDVFKRISFLVFCISGFSAVCLLNLLNPFIELWVGESFVLPYSVAVIMSVNFFFMQNRSVVLTFKHDAGIFRPDMYKPIIEVFFNLGLSIILALHYGVLGVVIGTLANTILVCIGTEAYIVHKHLFKCSVWNYAKSYIIQILALLVACTISLYANNFVGNFVLKCLISISVAAAVYFLFFFRTEEFGYFVGLFRRMVKK